MPWARNIDPFDENTDITPAEWYVVRTTDDCLPLDIEVEVPPAIAFINELPLVERTKLQAYDDKCAICGDKYGEGEVAETPVSLPCNHVFGKDCLQIWLCGHPDQDDCLKHNNCPLCRRQYIFENRKSLHTIEGLTQLLRDADYSLLNPAGPLMLTQEKGEQWGDIKNYVTEFIKEQNEAERKKQEPFMNVLRKAICQNVSNAEAYIEILGRMEQVGLITRFLTDTEDDPDEDEHIQSDEAAAIVNAMDAMPYDLQALMNDTYLVLFEDDDVKRNTKVEDCVLLMNFMVGRSKLAKQVMMKEDPSGLSN